MSFRILLVEDDEMNRLITTPGRKLLIVDDEELNRDVLGRRLELHGYHVALADNGAQALDLVERQTFDLVLLDIMMPFLSGLEVLGRLRSNHLTAELPVIMVSARNQREDVDQALQLGATDYITKPIDFPAVLARIATHIGHRRAQEPPRASETPSTPAAHSTGEGLWDWDLRTDQVCYSPRWKAMLGYADREVGTSPEEWLGRVHPDDLPLVRADLAAHRQGITPHFQNEHRILHKDNTYRWMLSRGDSVEHADGEGWRIAGSQTDITVGKVGDGVTGLPSRVLFIDRLERAIKRSKQNPESRFAVLFLDLDRFKLIDDSFGRLIGDQLLIAIARRLESCLRSTDSVAHFGDVSTIARQGGVEFTILLDDLIHPEHAARVAGRVQTALAAPFLLNGHEIWPATRIGITFGGTRYHSAAAPLRSADMALSSVGDQGKARLEGFDAAMRDRAEAVRQMENDLRHSLERQEFRLHYQPILSLETDRIVGVEALLRWQHKERGLIAPDVFIPVAEDTGLIVPIGWWVLREACHQMSRWRHRFTADSALFVCVNFSTKQLLQADLPEGIVKLLEETGLDPHQLKLEISESTIMDDHKSAAAALARLRDLGVQVNIDDFGTGRSTLSSLCCFPIETVKVDRSFVARMTQDHGWNAAESIVIQAHDLNLVVVAEGVETEAQYHRLKSVACEFGQGFYFSRPVDGKAAERLLAAEALRPAAEIAAGTGRVENAIAP
jgi:diguanylate cyclase (GGDEF)-like protein